MRGIILDPGTAKQEGNAFRVVGDRLITVDKETVLCARCNFPLRVWPNGRYVWIFCACDA
jgi:hypothetical protein